MVIESMLLVEFIRAGIKRRGTHSVLAEQLESLCGQRDEMSRSEWAKRVQIFAAEYGWEARFTGGTSVEFTPKAHH